MYFVVDFRKLGTTFCVNFEQQRCKILVYMYTVGSSDSWKMPSASNWRRRKVLTLQGHVLATLVSQTTYFLRLFLQHQGVIIKSCYYCI